MPIIHSNILSIRRAANRPILSLGFMPNPRPAKVLSTSPAQNIPATAGAKPTTNTAPHAAANHHIQADSFRVNISSTSVELIRAVAPVQTVTTHLHRR